MTKKYTITTDNKIEITGLENLIKRGVERHGDMVHVPIANWEFIETVISKLKLQMNK